MKKFTEMNREELLVAVAALVRYISLAEVKSHTYFETRVLVENSIECTNYEMYKDVNTAAEWLYLEETATDKEYSEEAEKAIERMNAKGEFDI